MGRKKKECNEVCYVSALELDFGWTELELNKLDEAYQSGMNLSEIAQYVGRKAIEILIILAELIEKKIIEPSDSKLFGELKRKEVTSEQKN